jgi:AcrR family transcriptional regulator
MAGKLFINKRGNPLADSTKSKVSIRDSEVPTQIKNPDLVRERRRHIIDSTVKLFVEHGYHKTTTRMIAKASSFSIGSLYEYVSSKEDLLYLVCETIHEEVKEAVGVSLSNQLEGKERLAQIIRQYVYVCDKMADHILLMYQVTQFLPDKWKKKILENELDITQIFVGALAELSGRNGFPELDEKVMDIVGHDISILGQMWAFRRWHLQKKYTLEEYIEIQTKFIIGPIF